jgi:phospholipase D-like protein
MHSFDIDTLLRFTPPEYLCEQCYALLPDWGEASAEQRCPVCGVEYIPTDEFPSANRYLQSRGLHLHYADVIGHTQQLARIARRMRETLAAVPTNSAAPTPAPANGAAGGYPPMRALLESLQTAEHFVHFSTYGLSALLLGALKMTAQRVPLRGLVSGVKNDAMIRELTAYEDEAPQLQLRLFQDAQFTPHHKIVVIDGLLAFKGSANMTDYGWRKAAQKLEVVEVVTDVAEVVRLHNHFFSPAWVSMASAGMNGDAPPEQIVMASA